jgi:hypothetical protein
VALTLALALLGASGCVRTLDMPDVHPPTQADVTWGYAAVRSETRLFADYSAVDARILRPADAPAAPAPTADSPEP